MFKENLVFILVPIVSAPIFSPVVDQHPVATTDDKPIEDVDLVALDIDLVALDVVMAIPLMRSERTRRLTISDGYIVYLWEHKYDVGDVSYPTTYKEAIVSPQSNFWIDTMIDEMTSMSHNKVWSLVDLPDACRPIGCN